MKFYIITIVTLLLSACGTSLDKGGLNITDLQDNSAQLANIKLIVKDSEQSKLYEAATSYAKAKIITASDTFKVNAKLTDGAYHIIHKGKARLHGMKAYYLSPIVNNEIVQELSMNEMAASTNSLYGQVMLFEFNYNKDESVLYRLKEDISKRLLERNERREGIIIKVDETSIEAINASAFDSAYVQWTYNYFNDVLEQKYDLGMSMNLEVLAAYLSINKLCKVEAAESYFYLNPLDLRFEPILYFDGPLKMKDVDTRVALLRQYQGLSQKLKNQFKALKSVEENIAQKVKQYLETTVQLIPEGMHYSFGFFAADGLKKIPINYAYSASSILPFNDYGHYFEADKKKVLTIKDGQQKIEISSDVYIPEGFELKLTEGQELNLINNAVIISRSPVKAYGTAKSPIKIYSKDKTGQGLVVLNTDGHSILEYVNFKQLANLNKGFHQLSGSVLFFKSDVYFNECEFNGDVSGDDMLNIVNAKFKLSNSRFKHTFSDAFDGDFVQGEIINTEFNKVGNDGIDFSGSIIKGSHLKFKNIEDKAISGGEQSTLDLNHIEIQKSEIGIAGKDASIVEGDHINMENVTVDFTVFCKKKEYGVAKVTVNHFETDNLDHPYLLEDGSKLIVNTDTLISNIKSVRKVLYGAEYGKSSK